MRICICAGHLFKKVNHPVLIHRNRKYHRCGRIRPSVAMISSKLATLSCQSRRSRLHSVLRRFESCDLCFCFRHSQSRELPLTNPAERNALSLAVLRISVGTLFLIFCEFKLTSSSFTLGGGFQRFISHFLQDGAYPFMVPFLRNFVLPHATGFAFVVTLSELLLSVTLILGIGSRWASTGGVIFMLGLLLSADYPGPHAAFWLYWGAALPHLGLMLCFITFLIGDAEQRLSVKR
jgi:uncharacterized membrane protein YphA (DoxX/SURF4 family)